MLKIYPWKGRTYISQAEAQADLDNDKMFSLGPSGNGVMVNREKLAIRGQGFVIMPTIITSTPSTGFGWELRVNH